MTESGFARAAKRTAILLCLKNQLIIGSPPKINSLQRLAVEVCKVNLEAKQLKFLSLLDEAFIDSRYPDDVAQFEKEFDIEKCENFYVETKEIFKCLKNLIKMN